MSVDTSFDPVLVGTLALLGAVLVFARIMWLLVRPTLPSPRETNRGTPVKTLGLLAAMSVILLVVAGYLSRSENPAPDASEFASSSENVSATSRETPAAESAQGGSTVGDSDQDGSEDSPADVSTTLTVTPQADPTIDSTPVPTVTPQPEPTTEVAVEPTATLTPEPEPTVAESPLDPESIVERAIAAESEVRSGRIDAMIDYGTVSKSSSMILFDLGTSPEQLPRLRYMSTYESSEGSQSSDRITVGDRTWSIQPDGSWLEMEEEEGVWGQVQAFLPYTSSATDVAVDVTGATAELRWYDAARDVDVVLTVDAQTGTPLELERIGKTNGRVVNIVYWAWNVPVDIEPPVGS